MLSRIWSRAQEGTEICLILANATLMGAHLATSAVNDTIASVAVAALQSAAYFSLCAKYEESLVREHQSFGSLAEVCILGCGVVSTLISSFTLGIWLKDSIPTAGNKMLWATANFLSTICFLRTAYFYGPQMCRNICRFSTPQEQRVENDSPTLSL